MTSLEKRFEEQVSNLLEGKRVDTSVFNSWAKRQPASQGQYAIMAQIAKQCAGMKKNGNGKAKATE